MIRVLLADDHPVVRHGLARILASALPGPVSFEEAADAEETLDLAGRHPFDIVLLDLSMPRGGGLSALAQLRRELPRVPVLVLSVHAEEEFALRALRGGAAGYLSKETAPEELVHAVQAVLAGRRFLSPALAELLAEELERGRPGRSRRTAHDALSDREVEIARLLVAGRSVTEIARELGRSVKTVSTLKGRALKKLGLRSTVDLARYAMETGFLR